MADGQANRDTTKELNARFITATSQFADTVPTIRLAGAYALAALADDWTVHGRKGERQVCIDVLCSYLRSRNRHDIQLGLEDPSDTDLRKTVQRIIAEHLQLSHSTTWRTSNFDFTGATFTELDLKGANFAGSTSFDKCYINGEMFSLANGSFVGQESTFCNAVFAVDEADFMGAVFDSGNGALFTGSDFSGAGRTNFSGSRFKNFVDFTECDFGEQVHFANVSFEANTSFYKAQFHGWASFENAIFAGAQSIFTLATFARGCRFDGASIPSGGITESDPTPRLFDVSWWADTQPDTISPKPWPPNLSDKPV